MGTKKRTSVVNNFKSTPDKNEDMRTLEELLLIPEEINEVSFEEEIERDPLISNLTYRQKLFAIHYCKAFDGTRAAIAAGYSEKGAHTRAYELLRHPGVQQLIRRRQAALANASAISRDYVMTELMEIIEEQRMAIVPDRVLQMKALDMISKLNGYYAPELQLNVQNNIESIKIEIVKPNHGVEDTSHDSL